MRGLLKSNPAAAAGLRHAEGVQGSTAMPSSRCIFFVPPCGIAQALMLFPPIATADSEAKGAGRMPARRHEV